jgi:hypothetical protein
MTPGICGVLVAVSHRIKTDGGLEDVEGANGGDFLAISRALPEKTFLSITYIPTYGG